MYTTCISNITPFPTITCQAFGYDKAFQRLPLTQNARRVVVNGGFLSSVANRYCIMRLLIMEVYCYGIQQRKVYDYDMDSGDNDSSVMERR